MAAGTHHYPLKPTNAPRVWTAKARAGNSRDLSGIAEQGPFNRAAPIRDAPVARIELL
jgi:hypothetical protein